MPTVTLSPDALLRIEGGEVITWAECERRLLAARTPAPEGEEDFNSYLIEDRLEMAARASASSVFVCKLMDEAAEKIKELRTAMLAAPPVVPVGVSEVLDAAAYLKEQYGASYGLDHPVDRARIIAALRPTDTGWRDIATAPKDGTPILGWCVHDADPYFIEPEDASGRSRLTVYGAHTEGLSHVEDGAHVIVWGGSWDDSTHEYDGGSMPDWWFRADSEFEVTANPTHWMPLPAAPTDTWRE
jgi:hypothetical protein